MFKKLRALKIITLIIAVLIIVIMSIQAPWQYYFEGKPLTLEITAKVQNDDIWQLFYINNVGGQFNEADSLKVNVSKSDSFQTVKFKIYKKDVILLRLDTGSQLGQVEIAELKLTGFNNKYLWDSKSIQEGFSFSGDIASVDAKDSVLYLNIIGNDPYITSGDVGNIFSSLKSDKKIYIYLILCLFIILVCCVYIFMLVYKRVVAFLKDLLRARRLIFELAKKDLQTRYLGSYLGIIWAFVQPLVTILIFWFVFQIGFKSAPVNDFPFILWLICGMVPWFFFSEALQGATNSVLDNNYLVKKIVFRVSSLPIIRILSSLFIHLFFILVVFGMFLLYGYKPSIYNIQVIYYLFATVILLLGLSWITSSLVVFLRDLGQIIAIVIQFGFWLTPICWSFKIMPEKYQFFVRLNPAYYIIEGYRDSFINHVWFWQHYNLTIGYWVITSGMFIAGVLLFKRLRPHFADVI